MSKRAVHAMKSFRSRLQSSATYFRGFYDRVIMTPAFASVVMFSVATFYACVIVRTGDSYMGVNYLMAVIFSGPIYLLGGTLAFWHLLRFSSRSPLAWIAFVLNMVPFLLIASIFGAAMHERLGR